MANGANNDAANATLIRWADAHPIWYAIVGALAMLLLVIFVYWSYTRCQQYRRSKKDVENAKHYFGQPSAKLDESTRNAIFPNGIPDKYSARSSAYNFPNPMNGINGLNASNGEIEIVEIDNLPSKSPKWDLQPTGSSTHPPLDNLHASGIVVGSESPGDVVAAQNGIISGAVQDASSPNYATSVTAAMYNGVNPQSAFVEYRPASSPLFNREYLGALQSQAQYRQSQHHQHHHHPQMYNHQMHVGATPHGPASVLHYLNAINANNVNANYYGAQRGRSQSAMVPNGHGSAPAPGPGPGPGLGPPPPPPIPPSQVAVDEDMIISSDHETPRDVALDEIARPSIKSSGGDDDDNNACSSSDDADSSDPVHDPKLEHQLSGSIAGLDMEHEDGAEPDGSVPFPPQQVQGRLGPYRFQQFQGGHQGQGQGQHRAHVRSISDLRGLKGLDLIPNDEQQGLQWCQSMSPVDRSVYLQRTTSPSTLSELSNVTESVHVNMSTADSFPTFTAENTSNVLRLSSRFSSRPASLYGQDTLKRIDSYLRHDLRLELEAADGEEEVYEEDAPKRSKSRQSLIRKNASKVRFSLFAKRPVADSEPNLSVGNLEVPDKGDLPPLDEDEMEMKQLEVPKTDTPEPGSIDWTKSRGSVVVKKEKLKKSGKRRKRGKGRGKVKGKGKRRDKRS